MRRLGALALCAVGAIGGASADALGQETCRGRIGGATVSELLASSVRAMGVPSARVLVIGAQGRTVQDFQSDRSYPPFFSLMDRVELVYDPRTGAEHVKRSFVYPGMGPTPHRRVVSTPLGTWSVADSLVPAPGLHGEMRTQRTLDSWATVQDWIREGGARVEGSCRYREGWRTVLSRPGTDGDERLFLDEDSGFPIKLDWTERHATWGQRRYEVLWSTWQAVAEGAYFPSASFLIADGRVVRERTVGAARLVDPSTPDAPQLPEVPAPGSTMAVDRTLASWSAGPVDTVRVGPSTFVLAHRAYNEVVTLVGDTVVLLDATLDDHRARADSAWIARLFPGDRPVKVVVTDLAWPHIGGVRFWVARGATVVSHRNSEAFLREVVERRWTVEPDALERARARGPVAFRFEGVDDVRALGGGALELRHLDGIGGEGALFAWLPGAGFLWAGDFIQDIDGPSLYASEVIRATARAGLRPDRFAAQHQPLAPWEAVTRANPTAMSAR